MTGTDQKDRRVAGGLEIPQTEDRASLPVAARESSLPDDLESDDDYVSARIQAVFSSQVRAGDWDAPDRVEAFSIFGEVKLDFTRAILPPDGIVEVHVASIFGSSEITVPQGAEVELEGTPIFGSIEHKVKGKSAGQLVREFVTGPEPDEPIERGDGDPPLFRVVARSIFGSVVVLSR